jgi:hypothetical protein
MAYVVSSNTAGLHDVDIPKDAGNGGSRIIDYKGNVLRIAGWGESIFAAAEIDLNALRRARREPGMNNVMTRQRYDAFAASYAAHTGQPANSLLTRSGALKKPTRAHFAETQARIIQRLTKAGIL